jgi:hypothetical protein
VIAVVSAVMLLIEFLLHLLWAWDQLPPWLPFA